MPHDSRTRRQFFGTLAGLGAGLWRASRAFAQGDEMTTSMLTGVRLEPFVDPLPVPRMLKLQSSNDHSPPCRITISEFYQKLHRDLPPTLLWGFEGSTPGPTILAEHNCPVKIEWANELPERHRLLIDHSLHGAGRDIPEVRTTIHLHGGHVAADSDGYPEDWVVPGQKQHTFYPNRQPSATLWYHDHSMGITRLNAMMGLAGLYILRDQEEVRLGLPSDQFEIPLVLQDRVLDARGQIAYPVGPNADQVWVPEFFGTHVIVNGRVWPYLDVAACLYRFRLLNASNSRVFQMALTPQQSFMQIGTDGGLLAEPVLRNELLLAPGERLDVIVDFRGREGRRLNLVNYGPAPYPSGGAATPGPVMQFRVMRQSTQAAVRRDVPLTLARVQPLKETSVVKTRRFNLVEVMTSNGRMRSMLLNGLHFMDPVTEDPVNGTTEVWEFVNATIDAHPIHLHAVHFQLLNRQLFDVKRFQRTSEVALVRRPIEAAPEERGWKDTILCPPGQLTRIIIPFSGEPGRFVWHCHMLEHEDNEMMRPYILKAASAATTSE